MNDPDVGLLMHLDALLQEGSVTRAAARLGMSTPAMSQALRRLRETLRDPLLVRAGRSMVLTPRAEGLKERVHTVVAEARGLMAPAAATQLHAIEGSFVVSASDYVVSLLGLSLDRLLREGTPLLQLRFLPNSVDDAAALRSGGLDLAVGIYGELPLELRQRQLLTDRFVCVVRDGHPTVKSRLSLETYLRLQHIQVAPRGKAGGYVDDVLADLGHCRVVRRAVPYFVSALALAAQSDDVLTISERVARQLGPQLGLRICEVPFALDPYALSLVWHPRFDSDVGHRFLRDAFVRAASADAHERHDNARRRLDAPRKRPRRPRAT